MGSLLGFGFVCLFGVFVFCVFFCWVLVVWFTGVLVLMFVMLGFFGFGFDILCFLVFVFLVLAALLNGLPAGFCFRFRLFGLLVFYWFLCDFCGWVVAILFCLDVELWVLSLLCLMVGIGLSISGFCVGFGGFWCLVFQVLVLFDLRCFCNCGRIIALWVSVAGGFMCCLGCVLLSGVSWCLLFWLCYFIVLPV